MATPAMQGPTAHIALGLPLDDPAKLRATNRRLESRQRPGSAGLALFLAGRTATGAKAPVQYAKDKLDALVTQAEWAPVSPLRNRFINGSHVVFNVLQVLAADAAREQGDAVMRDDDNRPVLQPEARVHVSRQYRMHLEQYWQQLQHAKGDGVDREIAVVRDMRAIWHLMDVIFVSTALGDQLSEAFATWVNVCHADTTDAGTSPSALLTTFQRLHGLDSRLVRGDVAMAERALQQLDDGSLGAAAASIRTLLRTMPRRSAFAVQSEFTAAWTRWQQRCRTTAADLTATPRGSDVQRALHRAARLLCGEADALAELSDALSLAWYDVLAATLTYLNPTAQSYDVPSLLDDAIGNRTLSRTDEVMRALLELDTTRAISLCSQLDPWLTAHLTDFLHHCGLLDPVETVAQAAAVDLREYCLLEYGSMLLAHPVHWQAGVAYLRSCPVMGLATLEALLERVPITSAPRMLAVLTVCQECGFADLAQSIHRVRARQAVQHRRYGEAIAHYLSAGDEAMVVQLADQLLDEYLTHVRRMHPGTLSYGDIVELLERHSQSIDRLAFLRLYFDFHRTYTSGDYKAASALLVRALVTQVAPKRFWRALLLDAVPLLEAPELYFNVDETYELMRCLEDLLASAADPRVLGGRMERAHPNTDVPQRGC